jgi:hypothetical protein
VSKTGAEIIAPQDDLWTMYTDIPSAQGRAAVDDQIVRVSIEKKARTLIEEKDYMDQKLDQEDEAEQDERSCRKRGLSDASVPDDSRPLQKMRATK